MKIFVSGGTDFIGKAVISELLSRKHNVTALVGNSSEGKQIEPLGAKYVIGDLLKSGDYCDAIRDSEAILSLDRPVRIGENIPEEQKVARGARHTERVVNLIKAASDGKARKLVLTFDTQCYGDRHGKWVEGDPGAIDPAGYCRPLRGHIETIEENAQASEMVVVSVYPGIVYGNGGWLSKTVNDMKAGKAVIVEPADNFLNLIHVEDLARVYALAIERVEVSNTYVFTDNMPVTQKALIGHLSDLLDVAMPKVVDFKTCEARFGRMEAEAMSMNTKTSSSKTFEELDFAPKYRSYELGLPAALKSMGIEPREKVMKKRAA